MNHRQQPGKARQLARTFAGMAVVVAAASFGTAHADVAGQDWKGYSGVNCLSTNDSAKIQRTDNGQVAFGNKGTTTITVFCPVVRDVAEAGEDRVTRVRVRFRNRNEAVEGRCEFSSRDSEGNTVDTRSVVAPLGEHELTIEGPIAAEAWGSYVLSCQIPGIDAVSKLASYIVNYRVDEKLP